MTSGTQVGRQTWVCPRLGVNGVPEINGPGPEHEYSGLAVGLMGSHENDQLGLGLEQVGRNVDMTALGRKQA